MHVIALLIAYILRPILWPLSGLDRAQQEFFRGLGKGAWYLTQGRVENVDCRNTGYMWRVTLQYSYSAENETWSGTTFQMFVFERDARNFADKCPLGTPLAVRYHPIKAGKSVVLRKDQHAVAMGVEIS